MAGGSPAASNFSLLRQRKVTKRKATLLSATLRFATGTLRCSVQPGSRSNSPAAQTIASPDPSGPALLGADRRAWERIQTANTNSQLPQNALCAFCSPIPISLPPTRPGWAEQRRWRRDQGRSCLSRRRVLRTPAGVEQHRLPGAQRRDPDCGSPFLCLLSFGEAKDK